MSKLCTNNRQSIVNPVCYHSQRCYINILLVCCSGFIIHEQAFYLVENIIRLTPFCLKLFVRPFKSPKFVKLFIYPTTNVLKLVITSLFHKSIFILVVLLIKKVPFHHIFTNNISRYVKLRSHDKEATEA